jgi:hypothetical protein
MPGHCRKSWIPEATPRAFLSYDSQQWLQLGGAEEPTLLYNTRSVTDKASALVPQCSQVNLTSEGYYLQILDLDFRPGSCKWRQHSPTRSRSCRQNLLGGPGAFKSASCQHFLGSVFSIYTFIEFAGKSRCHGLLQCDLEYHIIPQASRSKPLSRENKSPSLLRSFRFGMAYHTSPDRFSHHPKR